MSDPETRPIHPDDEPKVDSVTCLSCGAEMIPSTIAYHHTFHHKELDSVQYRIDKVTIKYHTSPKT